MDWWIVCCWSMSHANARDRGVSSGGDSPSRFRRSRASLSSCGEFCFWTYIASIPVEARLGTRQDRRSVSLSSKHTRNAQTQARPDLRKLPQRTPSTTTICLSRGGPCSFPAPNGSTGAWGSFVVFNCSGLTMVLPQRPVRNLRFRRCGGAPPGGSDTAVGNTATVYGKGR